MEKGRARAGDARQENKREEPAPARFISVPSVRPHKSLRLCAQVTSVQLRVQLACARGHLRAPEETGCKDLRCSDKESLDGERLNWGKGVGSLGRRMGDLRSDLTRVWGALLVRLDAQGRRAPGPASRLFSAELFPPPTSLALPLSGRSPGTASHIHSPFLLDLCCRVERPSLTSFS